MVPREPETFAALGDAELYVAGKLKQCLVDSLEQARKLVAELEDLVECDFEASLLDVDRRKAIVAGLPHIERLPGNLAQSGLVALIVKTLVERRDGEGAGRFPPPPGP